MSTTLLSLALTGAGAGTLLDGIHSSVDVLVYDSLPVTIGGLHTSLWVPPLLGAFYFVLGGLVIFFDGKMIATDPTTKGAMRSASLPKLILSFVSCWFYRLPNKMHKVSFFLVHRSF